MTFLSWPRGTRKPARPAPSCRPALEELEPRLVPAEVGVNDFRISFMGPDGDTRFGASFAALAYNSRNNEYLVVWEGNDNTGTQVDKEIYGQRLNAATGALLGGNIRISDMGPDGDVNFEARHPAVAYNGVNNEYLVVWQGDDNTNNELEIFGQRLNAATGAEVGTNDFRISDMGPDGDTDFAARVPAVAYNGVNNEYLVVWQGDDDTAPLVDGEREIFGQRLNAATGEEVGDNDFRISDMGPDGDTNFAAFFPAVAYNSVNNEYLVAWLGTDNTGPLGASEVEVFGQRLNAATGVEVGANDFPLSDLGPGADTPLDEAQPAVAYNSVNNEYLVVWHADYDIAPLVKGEFEIFGQRLNAATGAAVGANDFRISDMGPDGDKHFAGGEPAVAYNAAKNEYLVVWHANDNSGTLVVGEVEIFGQRLNAATGAAVGANDFRLSDMGPDGNPSFAALFPAVAYNGANNEYLVVWAGDDTTDKEFEIYGQRFAPLDPPPSSPPPPPQIVAVPFRKRGVSRVRVKDAATGAVRAVLTPFKGFGGRLRLQLRDVNGDDSLDLIVRALIHGKRRKKVFDAVTLAPLPPGLA
jgi:hypothetical protein